MMGGEVSDGADDDDSDGDGKSKIIKLRHTWGKKLQLKENVSLWNVLAGVPPVLIQTVTFLTFIRGKCSGIGVCRQCGEDQRLASHRSPSS